MAVGATLAVRGRSRLGARLRMLAAVRGQQLVEEWDGGVRVDGGPVAEGVFPNGPGAP